jgi:hypothetical protein
VSTEVFSNPQGGGVSIGVLPTVDGELFGYLVLVTDTERNIEWVRRFWGARVVLRTGVIYTTSLRSGLVTHVAWLYVESPKPHGEIIQQFRGLHSIGAGYKVKIIKPVTLRAPVRNWGEALQLAYEVLARNKPPVKRIQVRTRGHGCGCSRELFKNLRDIVAKMGYRTTSHSGRRYILEVMAWPRWKYNGLPIVTIGLYPHDQVLYLF